MARLLGPENRTVLRISRESFVRTSPKRSVKITTDEAGTTPASILAYQSGSPDTPGSAITGGVVVTDMKSQVPLFWFPDGVRTVYAQLGDGRTQALTVPGDASIEQGIGATLGGKDTLNPARFVGLKTTTGAPTTGTWLKDDWALDSAGAIHLCTVAGTPGTWT